MNDRDRDENTPAHRRAGVDERDGDEQQPDDVDDCNACGTDHCAHLERRADDRRFAIAGDAFTLAEMLDANRDTPEIGRALRALAVGETLDEPHAERVTRIQ